MTAQPAWTPDRPIISLKAVHKSFGQLEVLKGVSFDDAKDPRTKEFLSQIL